MLAAQVNPLFFMLSGMVFVLLIFGWIIWISKLDHAQKMAKSREKLHGELLAYVAEGSISPDDAERLITALREPDADVSTLRDSIRLQASVGASGADPSPA